MLLFSSELNFRTFCLILGCSVVILISIFPSLRKVSWKPIVALFLISRALDIGTTLLAFQMGYVELEGNRIIRELYLWVGFNNLFLLLFVLVMVFMALGLAWFIKILISCKDKYLNFFGYFSGYFFTIGSFIVFVDWLVFLL